MVVHQRYYTALTRPGCLEKRTCVMPLLYRAFVDFCPLKRQNKKPLQRLPRRAAGVCVAVWGFLASG